ncbi:tetratricopeptide repeat protein [Saccharothrix sp.]|uniref:tetratricopeptide repeat protein n=1 Tax=Saccharothrix sp. TaxID=1873460 RepID=UPI0028112A13|nr:tetratricopeptide repeat protein [Saccharothrix sp.]
MTDLGQFGVALDRAMLNQAGRDLYLGSDSAARGPGLASLAVPEDVTHTVRGRGELLGELVATVRQGGQVVVLHGNGGYGKTTVAAELAKLVAHSHHVWWVDATSAASVTEGLREVALRTGALPDEVRAAWSGDASATDLLWSGLAGYPAAWLLVLDNADDPRLLAPEGRLTAGRGWLRRPPTSGTVIVTSRDSRSSTWGRYRLVPVGVLDVEDAAAVLLDLAPDAGTLAEARELATRLGGLPLALRLAGTYLKSTSTMMTVPGAATPRSFAEYEVALADGLDLAGTTAQSERELLSRTWELSLDLLAERGAPLTRPLLRLLSTFEQMPIPTALLDARILADSDLFAGLTAHHLATLLEDLRGFGLIEYRSGDPVDVVVLHPLVREANLHHGDTTSQDEVRWRLLERGTSTHDPSDPQVWPMWRAMLPHCMPEGTPDAISWAAAMFCYHVGLDVESEALYRKVLASRLDVLGAEHVETLNIRMALATILYKRGDHFAAEQEYRALVEDFERTFGPEHPDTLSCRYTLALALAERDTHLAEEELLDLLKVRTRVMGAEDPDTLDVRQMLAWLRMTQDGGDGEAEAREVLRLQRQALGPDHSAVLFAHYQIAGYLDDQGDLEAASADYDSLVTAYTRTFGPEHRYTLDVRHARAVVLGRRGHFAAAEAELREVLAIRERLLGDDHPETQRTHPSLKLMIFANAATAPTDTEQQPDRDPIGERSGTQSG